jgi:hypothetical protein
MIKESVLINESLRVLKECLRTKVLRAREAKKHIHVPYRGSKITLLLKDTFDLSSMRQCKTVVIACVSPNALDAKHTVSRTSSSFLPFLSSFLSFILVVKRQRLIFHRCGNANPHSRMHNSHIT